MQKFRRALVQALRNQAVSPAFPVIVGALAFVASLSVIMPFGGLLSAAVVLDVKRWRAIALCASLGAAAGASLLYLGFVRLGPDLYLALFPQLAQSPGWLDTSIWLNRYGAAALLAIAALPVPLTPVLLLAALAQLPWWTVALVLWVGRLTKFYAYAWSSALALRLWSQA